MKKVIAICVMLLTLTGCSVSTAEYVDRSEFEELQEEYDALKKDHTKLQSDHETVVKQLMDAHEKVEISGQSGSTLLYDKLSFNIPEGFKPNDIVAFQNGTTRIAVKEYVLSPSTTIEEYVESIMTADALSGVRPEDVEYYDSKFGPAARFDYYDGKVKKYYSYSVIDAGPFYAIITSGDAAKDCEVIDEVLEGMRAN